MPRNRKDFLLNPFVIAVVSVILIIAAFNFWNNLSRMSRLDEEIEEMEARIAQAEAENEELKYQLENTTDEEYIEQVAREKLGLVKPGEMLLVPIEEQEETEEETDND
ncbi:FtsB family cell division protein [Halanaerobium hydrogeniformans]|uniref:Septum formation initiator n=1 Tax=Halanaerobium hydrogeniformans TaxID=656519 RepID=E4RJH1_HALHG|nr:septum formation initiator family protein [Halanaerobium hydrogeniformans]ADQ15391.1 Septum formation initiator [Halanaerobium hydrogeniformans]